MNIKSIAWRSVLGLAIILAAIWWFTPQLRYNIHTVIPNKIYRSAELPAVELAKIVKTHHLRTIINLRSMHPGSKWWEDEAHIAKRNDVALYNVSLPAHDLPTKEQLQVLTFIIKNAPRPLLIHCRQGADRSGMAAAIALILRNEPSLAIIGKQASWRYLAFDSNSVGKLVLPYYQAWLKKQGAQKSSAKLFTAWLNQKKLFNLKNAVKRIYPV